MVPAPSPATALDRSARSGIPAAPVHEQSHASRRPAEAQGRETLFAPEEHPELLRFLSPGTFGGSVRVVWECETDSASDERASSRFVGGGVRGPIRVAAGSGVGLALGLAAARGRLKQQHWIVVVASADSLLQHLSHAAIEQLQHVESRLLVVVLDDGNATRTTTGSGPALRRGQFEVLDARWLSELGLDYHGPVDGRNMASVQIQLRRVTHAGRSAVLHLSLHEPGPGARHRSQSRSRFGIWDQPGAVDHASLLAAVSRELSGLIESEERVFAAIDPALAGNFRLLRERPDRCRLLDGGGSRWLAETRGLALGGCRPFVVMSGDLLQRSLEVLSRELCRPKLGVTLVVESGRPEGALAEQGEKPPSTSDLAHLRLLPNLVILAPRDERELRQCVAWSQSCDGPVAIQVTAGRAGAARAVDAPPLELGRAQVLSEGFDVALWAIGSQVDLAERAAERLSEQGVSVTVVNSRFVQPLDQPLLERLSRQVGGLVVLEEESGQGGFGSAVLERLAESGIALPVIVSSRQALSCEPVSGPPEEHLVQQVVRRAVDLVGRSAGIPGLYGEPGGRPVQVPRQTPMAAEDFGLSVEALRREHEIIAGRALSREVEDWLALYWQAGERQRFLWQWCEQGAELTTLPDVSPELFDHVCRTKVLSIMLCVLLDDVADQRGRERFLEAVVRIVDGQPVGDDSAFTADERAYAAIAQKLAAIYHARVREYPLYDAYAELLRYDQLQYFNTMRYSQMLNRNLWLLNPVEHDLYLPHAMDMMSFATIDLMCMPQFDIRELGRLRESLWYLQCMGRVGNLLSTWRREIGQHDFTAGVFARAVARGDITVDQLHQPNSQEIEAAILRGDHERYYYRRWRYYRDSYLKASESIRSVEMVRLLEGNERFFRMHLAGRGVI